MECLEISRKLSAYADDELSITEMAEVETHLGECPACSRQVETLRALQSKMRQSLAERIESPDFSGSLLSQLRLGHKTVQPRLVWGFAAAACLIAVVALSSLLIVRQRHEGYPATSGAKAPQPGPQVAVRPERPSAGPLRGESSSLGGDLRIATQKPRPGLRICHLMRPKFPAGSRSREPAPWRSSHFPTVEIRVTAAESTVANGERRRRIVAIVAVGGAKVHEEVVREVVSSPPNVVAADIVRPPLETVVKRPALRALVPGSI